MIYMRVGHTNDEDDDLLKFNSMSECIRYMSDMGIEEDFMILTNPALPDEYSIPEGYTE